VAQKLKLKENESISNGRLHFQENMQIKPKLENKDMVNQVIVSEAKKDGEKKLILKPRIEAIHAGRTRNHNIYPSDKLKGDFQLKSGVYSFLYPYPKPMLKNHDHYSEPTGRVRNAQFITDSLTNRDAIMIIPEITDPDTIEKVLDGRYMTVSIGASTDAAMCNICGTDILSEGWCGHERGETYDGVECGWIVGNLFFDECSWVNVPADSDATIIDTGEPVVMEAYAQVGEKYFDLSSGDKAVELKESAARILGLHTDENNEPEGGKAKMNDDKTIVTVESLQVKLDEMENSITEKDALLAEKDAAIEEKDATIAQKEEEVTSLNEKLQENEEAIAEKDALIEEKDAKIAELEEATTASEAEKEALTEEVAGLKSELFKALVERVVDFKQALGKPLAESREEAIEAHLERSEESLKDTLADLMVEFGETGISKSVITNPAGGVVEGEGNAQTLDADGNVVGKTEEDLSELEILISLFKGLKK
jgi:hypothetical protein